MRGSTRRRSKRCRRSGSVGGHIAIRLMGYLLAFVIGATSAGVGFFLAWGTIG